MRRAGITLPVMSGAELRLIDNRWLQLGDGGTLVSLHDDAALRYFHEYGSGDLIRSLAATAVERALQVYVADGREAFLEAAPVRRHRERHVQLPERVAEAEIYPSLVEELRYGGFRYSDQWEATILVRLSPADEDAQPVILEISAGARSGGITADEVELRLWETRRDVPKEASAKAGDAISPMAIHNADRFCHGDLLICRS